MTAVAAAPFSSRARQAAAGCRSGTEMPVGPAVTIRIRAGPSPMFSASWGMLPSQRR